MRFRPCIDLHDGKVKQIVGATLGAENAGLRTNFSSTLPPAHFAALYRRDNLTGGHIIMLGPGNEAAALDALAAWPGGMQLGGGITDKNA
ncbi:MAG: phosphoribosylformimino-5-aminoimidazole carboxamide ribotide isomerase, partial [Desulfobulbus sp.]|nr:phosphoribosylformimino-5-aminoimidazole carboxamide ribotide isomerase [Desulfobulbus sp.]